MLYTRKVDKHKQLTLSNLILNYLGSVVYVYRLYSFL
jgi:hypothetical protein